MSLEIRSKKAKYMELAFICALMILLLISAFKAFPAGPGLIGLSTTNLEIGDRPFYINDSNPFGEKGYASFKGSFLYPKVLEIISFLSINVFGQSTTSFAWSGIAVFFTSIIAIVINRIIYASGRLVGGENTGIIAMGLFAISPYTYFYALSGGITMYTLFGVSLSTYLFLSLANNKTTFGDSWVEVCILFAALVATSSLRPSAIIFCATVSLSSACYSLLGLIRSRKNKPQLSIILMLSVLSLSIYAHQFIQTSSYSLAAFEAFVREPGTFFGYERFKLSHNINTLFSSDSLFDKAQACIYLLCWKILDFTSGIIDLRDTHSAESFPSLFSFIARIFSGMFYLAPLSLFSTTSILMFWRFFNSKGLSVCIVGAALAVSPSLLGVAMSRYYIMFLSPFLLAASYLISKFPNLTDVRAES